MRLTFRQFMEFTAAPPMGGAPSAPAAPDKDNSQYFAGEKRVLGLTDRAFDATFESPIDVWIVPNLASKWGFLVNGPVSAMAKRTNAGQYKVTFMLAQKKKSDPYSFILPYQSGQEPMYYDGPVEDKTEYISEKQLQDMMATPFLSGGVGAMGGMGAAPGGMGGPPPMGGM